MPGYAYRLPRKYRYRRHGKSSGREAAVGAVIFAVLVAATGSHGTAGHHGTAQAAAGIPGPASGSGTLSCSGLEALWESAGGSPSAAFMAAEIAEAESGGRQYSTDLNGGASTDRGYWQVNSVHGALSTYDAAGNARAAVLLSSDGTDWTPWVTYQTGAYQGKC